MAVVEFKAFGAYVRKAFPNDETDDIDNGNPGAGGLRCRLYAKETPSAAGWRKPKTFLLDLTRHPGRPINFTAANAGNIQCDAPGWTMIGSSTASTTDPAFEFGDDYVNVVYLSHSFWNALPTAVRPAFPPIPPSAPTTPPANPRKITTWPQPYEFTSVIYSSDDGDVARRRLRFVGFYAEVIGPVAGAPNHWNLKVFHCADGGAVTFPLDFGDTTKWSPPTALQLATGQFGSLYLEGDFAGSKGLSLPKLPPGQSFGGAPAPQRGSEIRTPAILDALASRLVTTI
jgi:hypothetical protein